MSVFLSLVDIKRYFIELGYNGTSFHGWQIQPNAQSVQACLDLALSTYFRQPIVSLGCGRTDAGVHARQFFAHFDLENPSEKSLARAVSGINSLLPYTIAVKQLFEVSPQAHARFDAISRAYQYHIHFHKDAFKIDRSWLYKGELEVSKMNKAAQMLFAFDDFSSFSKSHTQTFTNNCKIMEAFFEVEADGSLIFNIKADRFLRNMVRAIVGTLVLVGKGEMEVEGMVDVIKSKNRSNAGQSVPACGLYLSHVEYPSSIYIKSKPDV